MRRLFVVAIAFAVLLGGALVLSRQWARIPKHIATHPAVARPSVVARATLAADQAARAAIVNDHNHASRVTAPAADAPARLPMNPMEGITDRDERLRALHRWAAQDPAAALAWANAQPPGDDRSDALVAVCFGIAEKDPARAVQTAVTYGVDQQTTGVMENLVQQWAAADLRGAYAWAADQPAGEPRSALLARVAFIWSQSTPADAAKMVVEQIPPGDTQTEAVMTVLHQWAMRDPSTALEWVRRFPESPLRARAITELEGILQTTAPGTP